MIRDREAQIKNTRRNAIKNVKRIRLHYKYANTKFIDKK